MQVFQNHRREFFNFYSPIILQNSQLLSAIYQRATFTRRPICITVFALMGLLKLCEHVDLACSLRSIKYLCIVHCKTTEILDNSLYRLKPTLSQCALHCINPYMIVGITFKSFIHGLTCCNKLHLLIVAPELLLLLQLGETIGNSKALCSIMATSSPLSTMTVLAVAYCSNEEASGTYVDLSSGTSSVWAQSNHGADINCRDWALSRILTCAISNFWREWMNENLWISCHVELIATYRGLWLT